MVVLRDGALCLFVGAEPLVALRLPASARLTADQLLHFPQPPITFDEQQQVGEGMQVDDGDEGASAVGAIAAAGGVGVGGAELFVLSPDDTDNQFQRRGRSSAGDGVDASMSHAADCSVADLGAVVYVSHACGSTFLVHFACGANVHVGVDLPGGSELVQKCLLALHSALAPQQLMGLLQAYHRCTSHDLRVAMRACHHAWQCWP
jgi:hypothetical protein